MRYAIIENGKVINIALATPEFATEQGWIECPEGVGIGWMFNGQELLEPIRDFEAEWKMVRQKRNQLLSESDWTQGADIPQPIKDKWNPYRQALREIPQLYIDPKEIIWPNKPE